MKHVLFSHPHLSQSWQIMALINITHTPKTCLMSSIFTILTVVPSSLFLIQLREKAVINGKINIFYALCSMIRK